ncbi:glycosyltransferase [Actinomyces sp.]|uniref:glycosyltransferase n=1 Tax=Actinomyces sp. TaxID=29317 RepID=UPI0026DB6DFE|nr:glycosyltransferase [Actinomyces sp.]MDO4899383.1 glycosyltransferase [Actinomyces sp.]
MSGVLVIVGTGDEDAVARTRRSFAGASRPQDALELGRWGEEFTRVGDQRRYLLGLGAGDELEAGALEALERFATDTGAGVVTADRIEQGVIRRCQRWSERLFEQFPYTGRALLVRCDVYAAAMDAGLAEASTEWDAQLRLIDAADLVAHCPIIAVQQATPVVRGGVADRLDAVRAHLSRTGEPGKVLAGPLGMPLVRARDASARVSLILPTAFACRQLSDGAERVLADVAVRAVRATTTAPDLELVLIADSEADDDAIERCASAWNGIHEIVRTEGEFNYSHAVNAGVDAAHGDVVVLLNDDVEPLTEGWLDSLLGALGRPGVAAVGARLLFDDGRLQHIGIVCPPHDLPMHPRIFEPDDPLHPLAQADIEYAAVTGACLATRRRDYLAVGGMDESLPLNFNDVDLCIRLGSLGASMCVNSVRLIHRESSTRTAVVSDAERRAAERWQNHAVADPHIEYWG